MWQGGRGHRPVDQGPAAAESTREQRGVLVLGRHEHPAPLERRKVAGRRQADERAGTRITGVNDHVLVIAQRDPRILDSKPLRVRREIWKKTTIRIDRPVGQAVRATGNAEMGEAGAILHADEEDRLLAEPGDAGIEDGVDGVRPVGRHEDRIPLVPSKQLHRAQGRSSVVRRVL
jgi:hypothetical protein